MAAIEKTLQGKNCFINLFTDMVDNFYRLQAGRAHREDFVQLNKTTQS